MRGKRRRRVFYDANGVIDGYKLGLGIECLGRYYVGVPDRVCAAGKIVRFEGKSMSLFGRQWVMEQKRSSMYGAYTMFYFEWEPEKEMVEV